MRVCVRVRQRANCACTRVQRRVCIQSSLRHARGSLSSRGRLRGGGGRSCSTRTSSPSSKSSSCADSGAASGMGRLGTVRCRPVASSVHTSTASSSSSSSSPSTLTGSQASAARFRAPPAAAADEEEDAKKCAIVPLRAGDVTGDLVDAACGGGGGGDDGSGAEEEAAAAAEGLKNVVSVVFWPGYLVPTPRAVGERERE